MAAENSPIILELGQEKIFLVDFWDIFVRWPVGVGKMVALRYVLMHCVGMFPTHDVTKFWGALKNVFCFSKKTFLSGPCTQNSEGQMVNNNKKPDMIMASVSLKQGILHIG